MLRDDHKQASYAYNNPLEALCVIDYVVQQQFLSSLSQHTLARLRGVCRKLQHLAEPLLARAELRMYPGAVHKPWRPNDWMRALDQLFVSVARRPLCRDVSITLDLQLDKAPSPISTAAEASTQLKTPSPISTLEKATTQWLALALGCAAESGCLPQVTGINLIIGADTNTRPSPSPLWGRSPTETPSAVSIGLSLATLFPNLTRLTLAGNWVVRQLASEPGGEQLFGVLAQLPLTDLDTELELVLKHDVLPLSRLRRLVLRGGLEVVVHNPHQDNMAGYELVAQQLLGGFKGKFTPALETLEFRNREGERAPCQFPPWLDRLRSRIGLSRQLRRVQLTGHWRRPLSESSRPAVFALDYTTSVYSMDASLDSMTLDEVTEVAHLHGRPINLIENRSAQLHVRTRDLLPGKEWRADVGIWVSMVEELIAGVPGVIHVQRDAHVPLAAAAMVVQALAAGVLKVGGALVVRWVGGKGGEAAAQQVAALAEGLLGLPAERRPGSLRLDVRAPAEDEEERMTGDDHGAAAAGDGSDGGDGAPPGDNGGGGTGSDGGAAAGEGGGTAGGSVNGEDARVTGILETLVGALSDVCEVEVTR